MQILVVVANIQARTLKAEVEKGFVRTVFDHELVDPKAQINLVKGDDRFLFFLSSSSRKAGGGEGSLVQVVPVVPKGNRG